jgi:hypothetical protein
MNKTTKVLSLSIVMFALVGLVTFPTASASYTEGCTPGFWKNNADKKDADQWPIPTDTPLSAYFSQGGSGGIDLDNTTFLEALNFKGKDGAEAKLLRAAAAAILNVEAGVAYPLMVEGIVLGTNAGLASDDDGYVLYLKDILDYYNNLGCPLNNSGKGSY